MIEGLQNWDGLHPDGGYVEHITWVEKDNRAYDGTTGDWLITTLEDQGWKRPQPKPNPDSVLELQQLTKSNHNVEATRQQANHDQQQKLQHQHDIDQGIVKPMPDDLQKRINLLGNRK